MAKKMVSICDTCESESNVETYEVKSEAKRTKVDLCGEHAAPLIDLLNKFGKGVTRGRAAAAKPRASRKSQS